MTEAEFFRLSKSDQAALFALHQQEWMGQGAPVCAPDRTIEADAAITHWTAAVLQQSLARPDVEGKQAPTDEERESLRNDNWK